MNVRIRYSLGDYALTEKYGLQKIIEVIEKDDYNLILLENDKIIRTIEIIRIIKQNDYDKELTIKNK